VKILFLESFYGGSHKEVAQGFAEYSRHDVEILNLPPRFWKWRMRGAALEFIRRIENISAYDLIFATDMMDLTDFKALAGPGCPPVVMYFHENQLSYPLGPHEKRDFHLGFTNIVSALASDGVLFNSEFHRDDFFRAARILIKQMPDVRPSWMVNEIEKKTRVIYPGCRFPDKVPEIGVNDTDPPLVVWNHRWEYDKKPEAFFKVLSQLKTKGVAFSLAILGEQYEIYPKVFDQAKDAFQAEIQVCGYQESREDYLAWLSRGTVVVSTAIQENFGISVMEAMAHGCLPLLPDRLSYPELVPAAFRSSVIYGSDRKLEALLARVLKDPGSVLPERRALAEHAGGFSWEALIRTYDDFMDEIAGRSPGPNAE